MIQDSKEMLASILTLTPQKRAGGGDGDGGGIIKLIRELQEKVPELVDYHKLRSKLRGNDDPRNVVLLQEVARYAVLVVQLAKQLVQLERGSLGLEVISPELEDTMVALGENRVPKTWGRYYFSLKPLASWFEDLGQRYGFFQNWAALAMRAQPTTPFHYWIGAFTYPTGFTTSLLQRFSRFSRSGAPIDMLTFDFIPVQKEPHELQEHPKDGAYIVKLHLEGASWDPERLCLQQPSVMQLTCPLPVLHFKPI